MSRHRSKSEAEKRLAEDREKADIFMDLEVIIPASPEWVAGRASLQTLVVNGKELKGYVTLTWVDPLSLPDFTIKID